MEKLSVKTIFQLLDNMSYEDNKEVEDIIFKKKLNNLFYVKKDYFNSCYIIMADNEEDAHIKFTNSTMFIQDIIDHSYFIIGEYRYCKICKCMIDESIDILLHVKANHQDIIDKLKSNIKYEKINITELN